MGCSIWHEEVDLPHFPPLKGDVAVDVLIIGGGLAGLLCAYQLKQAGVDSLVLEAGRICGGTTGNTTAKLTAQHGLIYYKLTRDQGPSGAADYLSANQLALQEYRRLSREIDCGFEEKEAWVYTRADPRKLRREQAALEALNCPTQWQTSLDLPFPILGALGMPNQAQFHPLQFVRGILPGLEIRENTLVRRVEGCTAFTDRGKVRAKRILFCTHFPIINRRGCYFMKLYQRRSYVLALEGARLPRGMYIEETTDGLSFRSAGDLLLLGGGGHRTGEKGGGWEELRRVARHYEPQSREVAHWATQDCMSLDGIPYIGRYSPATPDWYVATGFNKWGMTSAMAAALLLRELLTRGRADWGRVFDPARTMKALPLAANLGTSAVELLTPSLRRCPHMGCVLQWNRQEHSWDCPCHGSRFAGDGRLLTGPALRNWNSPPKPPQT